MAMKPISKKLNEKQKEILARKLGYDGPMNMFEQFVKSDAAMGAKYNAVISKYMARGGAVKKFAEGGVARGNQALYDTYMSTLQGFIDTANNPNETQAVRDSMQGLIEIYTKLAEDAKPRIVPVDTSITKPAITPTLPEVSPPPSVAASSPAMQQDLSNAEFFKNNYTLDTGGVPADAGSMAYRAQNYKLWLEQELKATQMPHDLNAARTSGQYTDDQIAQMKQENRVAQQQIEAFAEEQKQAFLNKDPVAVAKAGELWYKNEAVPTIQSSYTETQAPEQPIVGSPEPVAPATPTLSGAAKEAYDKELASAAYYRNDYTMDDDGPAKDYTMASRAQSTKDLAIQFLGYTPQQAEELKQKFLAKDPAAVKTAGDLWYNHVALPSINDTYKAGTIPQTPVVSPPPPPPAPPTTVPTPPTTVPTPPTTGTGTTTPTTTPTTPGTTAPGVTAPTATTPTSLSASGVQVPQVTAATVPTTAEQMASAVGAPTTAAQITPTTAAQVSQAPTQAPKPAATAEAVTATPTVQAALQGVQPATGTVSEQALVTPATMAPTETEVGKLQAATGEATMVQAPAPRTVQAGELISGPAVDMGRVEETLSQAQAAQGVVTDEMTVAGQLQKLTADFDATNPPTWAAGAIRGVNAELTRRGVGVSSMAGQAIVQAALETALPIAAADAQTFREMGIQNLANRQQMAVLTAQQRAAFLGQEFDQAFQTRVINAATISEIANVNFTAEQQIALENARLTNTVNLANLSNQQALIMAEAAQIANLEMANLNNRQQAQVLNAQAFLQMDMANLSNEQQTELFKAQSMVNSILSDSAAENAARQFNASSINQVNQFYDGLTAQINQFNVAQSNGMEQFNVSQINAVAEFNAQVQNARDQFNAEFRRIIDQSNVEWRRNIALADTAAINRANEINATNAMGITTIEYNNMWQQYRDQLEMAWKTGESALDRENQLAMQVLQKQATIEAAKYQVEVAKYEALGKLAAVGLDKAMSGGLTAAVAALGISGVAKAGGAPAGTKTAAEKIMDGDTLPTFNGPVYSYNDALGMEVFSPEYEQFISNTYGTEIGSEQSEWLAEQDAWFYDGI